MTLRLFQSGKDFGKDIIGVGGHDPWMTIQLLFVPFSAVVDGT